MHNYKRHFFLCLATTLIVIIAISGTAWAEEVGFVNSTDGLNLRTGPATDYTATTIIPYGGEVILYDCQNGWMSCTYNGQQGYVASQYISFEGEKGARVSISERTVTGNLIVDEATKLLGIPYVYGGASPQTGFDCSGFVYYTYTGLGYTMERTAADQANQGVYVSKEELIPGDLVFFGSTSYINHVGIYVGDGMMIHSPKPGLSVAYASIMSGYHCNNYVTARRLSPPETVK
ncbi:MAG: NlpC/P60 family protein [Eubacteriales bacterium]|nr:NlpC/P60 family protein [Eubacteriales bacterium]